MPVNLLSSIKPREQRRITIQFLRHLQNTDEKKFNTFFCEHAITEPLVSYLELKAEKDVFESILIILKKVFIERASLASNSAVYENMTQVTIQSLVTVISLFFEKNRFIWPFPFVLLEELFQRLRDKVETLAFNAQEFPLLFKINSLCLFVLNFLDQSYARTADEQMAHAKIKTASHVFSLIIFSTTRILKAQVDIPWNYESVHLTIVLANYLASSLWPEIADEDDILCVEMRKTLCQSDKEQLCHFFQEWCDEWIMFLGENQSLEGLFREQGLAKKRSTLLTLIIFNRCIVGRHFFDNSIRPNALAIEWSETCNKHLKDLPFLLSLLEPHNSYPIHRDQSIALLALVTSSPVHHEDLERTLIRSEAVHLLDQLTLIEVFCTFLRKLDDSPSMWQVLECLCFNLDEFSVEVLLTRTNYLSAFNKQQRSNKICICLDYKMVSRLDFLLISKRSYWLIPTKIY
ncbi:hypothetical protein Ciccas_007657 [Cichlidogyrus casuarinus]|uniref:Uncharacterized protein n=1 Tax=Cichlidogyrus casuarinus TaxID=1844966 RepID=A0ABD2Q3N6_9PLAT